MPYRVGGTEEKLQQAAVRLKVPAGSFCYDAELGSRFSALTGREADPDAAALTIAQEALRSMPEASVLSAKYCAAAGTVQVTVECGGEQRTIEVKL